MEKETHVGEMLAQCIESEYGVKTEQYFIWEHTDQVPNELLARYLDLLHRNNARFLNVIRSEDGISIRLFGMSIYVVATKTMIGFLPSIETFSVTTCTNMMNFLYP